MKENKEDDVDNVHQTADITTVSMVLSHDTDHGGPENVMYDATEPPQKPDEDETTDADDLPVDQGYAWVILIAVFVTAILTFGGAKAFGVFFVEFLEIYERGSGATAWVSSTSMALMLGLGVISTWLCEVYSVRLIMTIGGVIAAIGHVTSAFVTRLEMLYLTYGLLTGIGRGLCFAPSLYILNIYFKQKRAFANGMAFAGSGIGSFMLPLITRILIDKYSLFGALLVFAGITLNMCVAAAFMRPLKRSKRHARLNNDMTDMDLAVTNTAANSNDGGPGDRLLDNEGYANQTEAVTDANKMVVKYDNPTESSTTNANTRSSAEVLTLSNISTPPKHTTFFSICCCWPNRSDRLQNKYSKSKLHFPKIDFSILKHPMFLATELAFLCGTTSYLVNFIMLPAHAVHSGLAKTQADWLISAMGIADIFGRIGMGWFSDLLIIQRRYLFAILLIIGGLASILVPLASNFGVLLAYAASVGLCPGAGSVVIFVYLTESLGKRMTESVFGIHSTLFALPVLFAPPITGWMEDLTGSWSLSFRITGSFILIGAFVAIFILPLAEKLTQRIHKDNLPGQTK